MGKRIIPILIIFVLGIGVSVASFFLIQEKIVTLESSRFEKISQQHLTLLKSELQKLMREAELVQLMVNKNGDNKKQLSSVSYPWNFDWIFAEVVNKNQLKSLLRKNRKDKSFSFHPAATDEAEFFMPVHWSTKNPELRGFDLLTIQESRIDFLALSEQTGGNAWSPNLKVGGDWSKKSFIVTYSVEGIKTTKAMLVGRLKLDGWLRAFGEKNNLSPFAVDFSLQNPGDSVILPFLELPAKEAFHSQEKINLFRVPFLVKYRTLPHFTGVEIIYLPWIVSFTFGLLILFFCIYLYAQARREEASSLALEEEKRLCRLYENSINEGFSATTVEELVWQVLKSTCEYAGWPVGHAFVPDAHGIGEAGNIWYIQEDKKYQKFREHSESKNFMTGHTLTDRVLAHSNYVWIPDITLDTTFTKSKMQQNLGVQSAIGVPVVTGGDVKMVLEFYGEEAAECDEALMEKVLNLSKQLGGLIEAKWAESKIRTSIGSMKGALDVLPQSVFLLDSSGRLTLMNYTATVNFGYNPADIRGMNFEIFLAEPFQSKYKHFFEAYRENPKAQSFDGSKEVLGKRKDGTQLPVKLLMKELDVSGITYIVVLVSHPGKENKLLKPTEKLEQLKEPDLGAGSLFLEPKKPLLGQNLTLLDPLLRINEISKQLLQQDEGDPTFKELQIQANVMEDNLEGLFALSRMQDGSVELAKEPFLLTALIDQVLKRAAPRVYTKGLELIANVQSDVPDKLVGDPFHLGQMLLLLVDNGARYAEKGEIYLEVKCYQSDLYQAQLVFLVRDSGDGISPSLSQTLMSQIRQDDRTANKKEEKTLGLTLSYVKELAHLMSGQVSINSVQGEWSLISFTTFVARQNEEVKHIGLEKSLGNFNTVVFDPNEIQRKVIQKRLTYHGARVQMCETRSDTIKRVMDAKNINNPVDYLLVNFETAEELGKLTQDLAPLKGKRPHLFLFVAAEMDKGVFGDYPSDLCHFITKPLDHGQPYDKIAEVIAASG